jgi:hypothetical protein
MKTKALLVIVGVFAFVGLLTWLTLGGRKVRVEVCMEHRGQQSCKTAVAADDIQALRTAIDNACGEIAHGVTENGQCTRSKPLSVRRLD